MVDPITIGTVAIKVLDIATSLVQLYRAASNAPQVLIRFRDCLEEFRDDVATFERVQEPRNLRLAGSQKLERLLQESEQILRKYQNMFEGQPLLRSGIDALKFHLEDERRLEFLTRKIDVRTARNTDRLLPAI